MKFIVNCNEATTICDKSQYGEAKIIEIIKLKLHCLSCDSCKEYSAQNSLINGACNRHTKALSDNEGLSLEELEVLRQNLEAKLNKLK